MKKPVVVLLVALGVPGAIAGVYFARKAALEEAEKEKQGDKAVGHIARVEVKDGCPTFTLEDAATVATWTVVEKQLATEEERATGEVVVAPGSTHEVRAAFAGVVGAGEHELSLGAAVQAGEKLATLAPAVAPDTRFDLLLRQRQAESDRDGARAELAAAEIDLARVEDLNKDGSVARRQLDEARNRITKARASVAEAERRAESLAQLATKQSFEESVVAAPVTGFVSQLAAARGARVQAGDLLFTVDARDAVRARVDLAPGLTARDKPPARIVLELSGGTRDAELVSVDPRVKPGTLFVSAYYRILGDTPRAGEPLEARLPRGEPRDAVSVPASALLIRDGETWAYVRLAGAKDTFARRGVTILARHGDVVIVSGGIKAGEMVVTQGAAVLLAEELKPLIECEGGPPDEEKPTAPEKAH